MDNYQKLAIKEEELRQLLATWYPTDPPPEQTPIGLDSTGTAASLLTFHELNRVGAHPIVSGIASLLAFKGGTLLTKRNQAEYRAKANAKNGHRNNRIKQLMREIEKLERIIAREEKLAEQEKNALRAKQMAKFGKKEEASTSTLESPYVEKGKGYKQVSAKDFDKLPTHKYHISGKWQELFGYLKKIRGSVLIFGKRKNGKTHLCVQLAQYLQERFGGVDYFSAEEGVEETFKEVAMRWDATFNVVFEMKGLESIENALNANQPKFVFFDSTSRLKLKIDDLVYLKDQFPKTFFFYVNHSNQDGSAKGGSSPEHEVDSLVKVVEGIAYQEGRMVQGPTTIAVFPDKEEEVHAMTEDKF